MASCHTHAATKPSSHRIHRIHRSFWRRIFSHRLHGCAQIRRVWHPAIPTQPLNYLPTEATEPTEVYDARYSPTDCTDVHRLGGYGILPYPRRHQTIFPQKPTQPNHLCASVKSVGGSSTPETSVNSVNSVGEPYAAKPSVCIRAICGRIIKWAAWVWQDAIPS